MYQRNPQETTQLMANLVQPPNYLEQLNLMRDDLKRRLDEVERLIELLGSNPSMLEFLNLSRSLGI